MAIAWRRAVVTRTCGYCVPRRVIAIGERYLVVHTGGREHVRCLTCAESRWGFEAPALEDGTDVDAGAAARLIGTRIVDWKREAAGDGDDS